ncbi:MAG: rhodanese-like domain-containing protein [Gammaproteobacteria bacterium]|nr:rhodanese-like domain-containing protein [Gammaproteobacteria bacterium]MBT5205387.1 rhodanese-like domain-containing protein [Gammaproteobacteria bacterium]MBT5603485.1 rhodanese-like domain-containing protein [Gammaproteobacteria bacterium]MBT6245153.1 rhodanese-like domain-containing protein [Gammaproteobacteria bacterium]
MFEKVLEFASNHPFLVGSFVFLVGALFFTESRKGGASIGTQMLVQLVNKSDALVVDLRDSNEFSSGHIAGALNIPFSSLEKRIRDVEKYKEKPIVLVCKMGTHSSSAGKKLIAEGYQDIRRLSGGMTEWASSNLPVVK